MAFTSTQTDEIAREAEQFTDPCLLSLFPSFAYSHIALQ